ncbi:MAG: glycosyltransferase family 9 protein [Verrucomicrobia subdivision 3 bacterium]|nr:glycosyltransferase family 9 protein [Limisphaerales bacterium]
MAGILVIRGGAIGDFILTLPALAALRRQFPSARLELLAYPHVAQLAFAAGLVDDIRSIDGQPLAGFFAPDAPLDSGLQGYFERFSVVISYLYDPDEIFQTNVRQSCRGQFIVGPHRPDERKPLHATEVFLAPLQRLAIFDPDPVPRLAIAPESTGTAAIALHPGSGSERKNWPLQNWIALANELARRPGTRLLLVGGEAERGKLEVLATRLAGTRFEVADRLPLTQLAPRLAACSAFVGHDSGITHLAAALGIPTFALWAGSIQSIWEPRGNNVKIIRHPGGIGCLTPQDVLEEWARQAY